MNLVLFGLLAYLVLMLGVGAWISRRINTEDDYLVAGRQMGPILVAASVFATWFGAESVIGASGIVYTDGLSGGSADPFGYGLALVGAADRPVRTAPTSLASSPGPTATTGPIGARPSSRRWPDR